MSSERSGEGISTCLCWFHHLWISFRFDEREDRTVKKPKTESPLLHLAVTTHHSIDPAEITGTLLIRLVGLDYNQAIAELMLILIFPAREKKLLIKKANHKKSLRNALIGWRESMKGWKQECTYLALWKGHWGFRTSDYNKV